MRKLLATVTILAIVGMAGCNQPEPAKSAIPTKAVDYHQYPPCLTEDQETGPCYWNAQTRGNGQGHSFYVDSDGQHHFVTN